MKTVAVIGASGNRSKFGNKALRAFERKGYRVFAINPNEKEVEGHRTFASVLDVPDPIDMATVCVPGDVGVRVMDDLATKGIAEVWLNPGADDEVVLDRALQLGLKVIQACSIIGIGDSPPAIETGYNPGHRVCLISFFHFLEQNPIDLPTLFACVFAAIAALSGGWALWLRRTMAREAELLQTIRIRAEQLEEANGKLEALSYQDALTAVGNRRAFGLALDREWRRGIRSRRPLSLLLLDIDHFKLFNDRYGHQAGDKVLANVASAMMEIVRRAGDQIARYGGEEFVVLAPDTDAAGSAAIAGRLRAAVEALSISHEGGVGGVVTLSVGEATVVPTDATTREALVAAADGALYEAKREGRNRVASAAPTHASP